MLLKKILIKNIVTNRFAIEKRERKNRLKKLKEIMKSRKERRKIKDSLCGLLLLERKNIGNVIS